MLLSLLLLKVDVAVAVVVFVVVVDVVAVVDVLQKLFLCVFLVKTRRGCDRRDESNR